MYSLGKYLESIFAAASFHAAANFLAAIIRHSFSYLLHTKSGSLGTFDYPARFLVHQYLGVFVHILGHSCFIDSFRVCGFCITRVFATLLSFDLFNFRTSGLLRH